MRRIKHQCVCLHIVYSYRGRGREIKRVLCVDTLEKVGCAHAAEPHEGALSRPIERWREELLTCGMTTKKQRRVCKAWARAWGL